MIEDELHLNLDEDIPGLVEYKNLPRMIGAVISSKMATLNECETLYSVEDIYLMLEVMSVDMHNRRVAEEWFRRNKDR